MSLVMIITYTSWRNAELFTSNNGDPPASSPAKLHGAHGSKDARYEAEQEQTTAIHPVLQHTDNLHGRPECELLRVDVPCDH